MIKKFRLAPWLYLLLLSSGCTPLQKVDFSRLILSGRDGYQHPERVIEALEITPGSRVADIGAGKGYWLPSLSRAVGDTGRVYAVEVEDDLIAELEARVARDGLDNVVVIRGEYADPELPDGEIDLAMTCITYHHIEDQVSYFRRLHVDLAPGGRVAHLEDRHDMGPPFRWFQGDGHWTDPEEVRAEMTEAGYRRVAEYDFLAVQSFQIFAPLADVAENRGP